MSIPWGVLFWNGLVTHSCEHKLQGEQTFEPSPSRLGYTTGAGWKRP